MTDTKKPSRKIPIKLIIISIIIGIFASVFYIGLFSNSNNMDINIRPVPKFSMPTITNDNVFFTSNDFTSDRPALLSIWASWCGPCRNEHKILMKLSKEHNIDIYGIAYKDSKENAIKFLQENGNPFIKSGLDDSGMQAMEWGITGVPETFVIDKNKNILFKHQGELTADELPKFLEKLKAHNFNIKK